MTRRAFILGVLFAAFFAGVSVYVCDRVCLVATQITVLPYALLLLTMLLVNPLCRLVRVVRIFSVAEIMVIFAMGMVSSGIATFGLSSQVVPLIGGLMNRNGNNAQSEWDQYVLPYMADDFFLTEPGIQAQAQAYRDALRDSRRLRQEYDAALAVLRARTNVALTAHAIMELRAATNPPTAKQAAALRMQEQRLQVDQELLRTAMEEWERARPGTNRTVEQVLDEYPSRRDRQKEFVAATHAALRKTMESAFARVDVTRQGLPRSIRACPGIVPLSDDTLATYSARWHRLWHGQQAQRELRRAYEGPATNTDRAITEPDRRTSCADALRSAVERLAPLTNNPVQAAMGEALKAELDLIAATLRGQGAEYTALCAEGRQTTVVRRRAIERELKRLDRESARLNDRKTRARNDLDRLYREVDMAAHIQVVCEDLQSLRSRVMAGTVTADETRQAIGSLMVRLGNLDTNLRGFFLGYVPWRVWARPLLFWGILIALTYLVLMTLNVLIFRQWVHNEKLVYPLAEVPECLAGMNEEDGRMPAIFRSGFFWIGFGISGTVLSYNLLCATHLVPGLNPIDLRHYWAPYIQNTSLQALLPHTRSHVFFTMIGLAFLIPQKVSFSLWFFTVVYMVELLFLVWNGYGVNELSFPTEWWYTLNFRTGQGAGAILVFSSVVFFRCRHYLLSALFPHTVSLLEPDERRELRISSLLFLLGSGGVILMLWQGLGANPWMALFVFAVALLITIALVRAVAEGGILGFQAWSSPFHFIRTLCGMNKAWTAPELLAPLMVYYAVFFLDLKAFIAPAMANALKIREDLRLRRGRFHLFIAMAILAAIVTAVGMEILLCYTVGADRLNWWFHNKFPTWFFDQIATQVKNPPAPLPGVTGWVIAGAAGMTALLYFRQFLFWLPHPIGMIMLVNPLMASYWFSILIGWGGKALVTKYGDQEVYARMRYLAIGLILGELILVIVSTAMTGRMGITAPFSLNQ